MCIKKYISLFVITFGILIIITDACINHSEEVKTSETEKEYKNHNNQVRYVGMLKCKECHADKFNTFIETGMGKSFDLATKSKSSGNFEKNNTLYDSFQDLYYQSFWSSDKLMFREFRLNKKDTIYNHTEICSYIIGSGQHTNSHLINTNGYVHQMPMTFYVQKGKWDFPPGFENGLNTRFDRKIGLECMSCHNAYPDFVKGSENKYRNVPNGIDCERCHGPGQTHIEQFESGIAIDTSLYVDYSIVNPAKLSIERQFDLCSRCHLQGNAVLKDGKSWYDYKPGMKLSDFWTVYLPRYKNADEDFIMASHADRLKQSKCFLSSMKNADPTALKPYKKALTCVSCHNPHISVKKTQNDIFNSVCKNCHQSYQHDMKDNFFADNPEKSKQMNQCFSCHMPKSSSTDIPHVTVTDHYIRVPISKKNKESIKKFIGLYAVNEDQPENKNKVKAYIAQYEKFEPKKFYLDSALNLINLKNKSELKIYFSELINIYFLQSDPVRLLELVNTFGDNELLNKQLKYQTYDNSDAWTSYRIAQTFSEKGAYDRADKYYSNAVELAPFQLDFQNKYAANLFVLGKTKEAKKVFEYIISEYPKHAAALTNLGYIYLTFGDEKKAEELYNKALYYSPDYEMALMNKAGLYLYRGNQEGAVKLLKQVLKKRPSNIKAKEILNSLGLVSAKL